jgi:tryptophanyl-tRNA synthetase
VVYGQDQDPYFRLARDYLPHKPACLLSGHLPALTGVTAEDKLSASGDRTKTLFLNDSAAELTRKIKKYCYGGNLQTDVAYHYLRHFLADELATLRDGFRQGSLTCSEMKRELTVSIR